MSVRMKLTHSKTASRRAHHRKGVPHLVATATGMKRRHFLDADTGMYRGKQIITVGKAETASSTRSKKKEAPKEKRDTASTEANVEKK